MLGWAIMFFIAAIVAGAFGFGMIATTFTGIAVVLFWVFVAVFVLSLLFGLFRGAEGAGTGGNGFALVALIAVIAIFTYAWVKNDWSAQQVGASLDHAATQVADSTSNALRNVGHTTDRVARDTSNTIRRDTDGNPHNNGG